MRARACASDSEVRAKTRTWLAMHAVVRKLIYNAHAPTTKVQSKSQSSQHRSLRMHRRVCGNIGFVTASPPRTETWLVGLVRQSKSTQLQNTASIPALGGSEIQATALGALNSTLRWLAPASAPSATALNQHIECSVVACMRASKHDQLATALERKDGDGDDNSPHTATAWRTSSTVLPAPACIHAVCGYCAHGHHACVPDCTLRQSGGVG